MQTYSIIKECWKNKYLFLVGIVLSVVLSVLITKSQQDMYSARMTLIDEHKEYVDLAVGLNVMNVTKRNLKPLNDGFENDPNVYTSLVKSKPFMDKLQEVYLPKYKLTYKQYVQKNKEESWFSGISKEDPDYVEETINNSLTCKVNAKVLSIEITFVDMDSEVASLMCLKVSQQLYDAIQDVYKAKAKTFANEVLKNKQVAQKDYEKSLKEYADFSDQNVDVESETLKMEVQALKDIRDQKYSLLSKLNTLHARASALAEKNIKPFSVLKDVFVSKQKFQPTPVFTSLAVFCIVILLVFMIVLLRAKVKFQRRNISLGSLSSPWAVSIFVWALILFLQQFRNPELLIPIEGQFYYALAIWLPLFCFFSFAMYNLLPSVQKDSAAPAKALGGQNVYEYSSLVFNVLFAFSVICTPMAAYKVYSLVSMFDTTDLLYNVRLLAVEGNEGMGFLSYTHVVNQVLVVIAIWHYPRVPLWKVLLLCAVNVISAIAIMEKGTLFFLAVAIFFVLFEKKVIKIRGIVIAGVILFLILFLFNVMRSTEQEVEQGETNALDFFLAMYILSPCQAFETLVQDLTHQTGMHTFDTVYLFMQRFGMPGIEVPPKVQEFVWLPICTNVYTIMQPFYVDFGYKGIAFFAIIYGSVSGWVYRSYHNGSNVARCVYVFFMYALVLQFYQEYIFLGIVPFIQFVFFTTLVCQNKFVLRWTSR